MIRIDHRGRVAQIDHLLINRFLDIFVLESKNYYYGVKISEGGEFLVWDAKTDQAILSSPVPAGSRVAFFAGLVQRKSPKKGPH